MHLRVERDLTPRTHTPGELFVNGEFFCFTLEDQDRVGLKVKGETAIPEGTYKITITWSKRFLKWMLLINDVPGFDGIRIHKGMIAGDTEGCLLVGADRGPGKIWNCSGAYNRLFDSIEKALTSGEDVTITFCHKEESIA